ncbi:MAG: heavy metal-binding domain-containing protein [Byssovorax sp.]
MTVNETAEVAIAPKRGTTASRVLILQSTHLDRPAEVVGIVDVHEETGHHDAALDELRQKAATMGADAVVGVEFHHSEGGAPTHLSGLAVRFVSSAP